MYNVSGYILTLQIYDNCQVLGRNIGNYPVNQLIWIVPYVVFADLNVSGLVKVVYFSTRTQYQFLAQFHMFHPSVSLIIVLAFTATMPT